MNQYLSESLLNFTQTQIKVLLSTHGIKLRQNTLNIPQNIIITL